MSLVGAWRGLVRIDLTHTHNFFDSHVVKTSTASKHYLAIHDRTFLLTHTDRDVARQLHQGQRQH
jgi:ribosomal silencing factor RsfS